MMINELTEVWNKVLAKVAWVKRLTENGGAA